MELHKSIDEVIEAIEICKGTSDCNKCPYHQKNGDHLCFPMNGNHLFEDSLFYLKKYRRGIFDAAAK